MCIRTGSGKVGVLGEKDAAVLRDADRRRLISGGSNRGCLYLHHRTLGDFDTGSLRARGGDLCIRQIDVRALAVAIGARRAVPVLEIFTSVKAPCPPWVTSSAAFIP